MKAFDARTPATARLPRAATWTPVRAPAMEVWMAEQCDYLLGYEVDRYNAIRPIAYTNWPTLDPLHPHHRVDRRRRNAPGAAKVGRPVPADRRSTRTTPSGSTRC